EQRAERRIDVEYDGRTLPIVWLAYKIGAFDPGDARQVALDLLAELAFGETSEAYRRLVLDEQVVEFLTAGAEWNRDPGLLDVYARVKDPRNVGYVIDVLDDTATRFRAVPPDLDALAALKSRIRYDFLMGFETADRAAERVARP